MAGVFTSETKNGLAITLLDKQSLKNQTKQKNLFKMIPVNVFLDGICTDLDVILMGIICNFVLKRFHARLCKTELEIT